MGPFRLTEERVAGLVGLLPCLALLLTVACSCGSCGDAGEVRSTGARPLPGDFPGDLPRPSYETAVLELCGQQVTVEIADTPRARAYGMMFVSELTDERGMLFMYPTPRNLGFWMRNTRIPLDIAFIAELGEDPRIINVHSNMEPFRESPSYRSRGECRFALELAGGWFERHDGGAGTVVHIPEDVLRRQAQEDGLLGENIPRRIGR